MNNFWGFIGLLFMLLVSGCSEPISIKQKPNENSLRVQFAKDSLYVERLIDQGDSLYGLRNKMGEMGESLIYFDSALHLAKQTKDSLLISRAYFFVGNVYNAWNKQPQKTISFYKTAFEFSQTKNGSLVFTHYLSYILAHAFDGEKANDSLKCMQLLHWVDESLSHIPDSVRLKMDFLPDFAWVATNVKNYAFAEKFLSKYTKRDLIKNDPQSNNYLDHYYLTKARIDIFGKKKLNSAYIDSLANAVETCSNKFDKQYYLYNLTHLSVAIKDFKTAYEARNLSIQLNEQIDQGEITSLLQKNRLLEKLNQTIKNKQESDLQVKQRNLWLAIIVFLILLFLIFLRLMMALKRKKRLREDVQMRARFTRQLFEVTEDERKRIASDLHDSIGNDLVNLRQMVDVEPGSLKMKIDTVIDEVRNISRNLSPAMFERVGLKITLEQLVERIQYSKNFMLTAELNYKGGLNPKDELQVYRIIQEAITNILKHADAIAGKIVLEESDELILIEIKDNGKGFSVSNSMNSTKAFGIHSILERSNAIGGDAQIQSDSSGTKIEIKIKKEKA